MPRSPRFEPFEECDLRFHHGDARGRSLHDAQPELAGPGGGIGKVPDGEQFRMRIDAYAEAAPRVESTCQSLPEGGHSALTRSFAYS